MQDPAAKGNTYVEVSSRGSTGYTEPTDSRQKLGKKKKKRAAENPLYVTSPQNSTDGGEVDDLQNNPLYHKKQSTADQPDDLQDNPLYRKNAPAAAENPLFHSNGAADSTDLDDNPLYNRDSRHIETSLDRKGEQRFSRSGNDGGQADDLQDNPLYHKNQTSAGRAGGADYDMPDNPMYGRNAPASAGEENSLFHPNDSAYSDDLDENPLYNRQSKPSDT